MSCPQPGIRQAQATHFDLPATRQSIAQSVLCQPTIRTIPQHAHLSAARPSEGGSTAAFPACQHCSAHASSALPTKLFLASSVTFPSIHLLHLLTRPRSPRAPTGTTSAPLHGRLHGCTGGSLQVLGCWFALYCRARRSLIRSWYADATAASTFSSHTAARRVELSSLIILLVS